MPVAKPPTPAWVLRLGRRFPKPIYRAAVWLSWTVIPTAFRWGQLAAQWLREFPPQFWEQRIAEPYRRRWPSTLDPQLVQLFASMTPLRDYAAIHCHDLPTLPVAASLRRMFFPKAKIIYDAHELYPYQIADAMYQRRWKRVERRGFAKPTP